MFLEADYSKDYNMELQEDYIIDENIKKKMENEAAEIVNRIRHYNSHYIERLNPDKKERIIWFYGQLKSIAFTNAGHVTLTIDENEREAELKYMGKILFKTKELNYETGLILSTIFYHYDLVTIEHEEEYFTITVYEHLYDKIMNQRE